LKDSSSLWDRKSFFNSIGPKRRFVRRNEMTAPGSKAAVGRGAPVMEGAPSPVI
jgi:hypothetical protein